MANGIEGVQMKRALPVTTLFLDIGGVLLTDGWDHHARRRAARNFKLKWAEMEDRHHLTFDTYEEGKTHAGRIFRPGGLLPKAAVHPGAVSELHVRAIETLPQMIELAAQLKVRYGLKIAVVSNEARELNAYRIQKFKLDGFVDAFISSCFVHVRKPDADIFRLALDIAQAPAPQVLYIENTPMFVQIAEGLGIRSILHTDYRSTCAKLALFGLQNEEGISRATS
jgi:putative hydrolase of the HAD superfamily